MWWNEQIRVRQEGGAFELEALGDLLASPRFDALSDAQRFSVLAGVAAAYGQLLSGEAFNGAIPDEISDATLGAGLWDDKRYSVASKESVLELEVCPATAVPSANGKSSNITPGLWRKKGLNAAHCQRVELWREANAHLSTVLVESESPAWCAVTHSTPKENGGWWASG